MEIKSEKTNERLEMIDRWKASGKSINSFCKEENIPYFTFLYWRDKLVNKKNRSGFVKIKPRVSLKVKGTTTCEIIFINGNRLNFSVPPDASYLKALLT
jgi:hypothetical protein